MFQVDEFSTAMLYFSLNNKVYEFKSQNTDEITAEEFLSFTNDISKGRLYTENGGKHLSYILLKYFPLYDDMGAET